MSKTLKRILVLGSLVFAAQLLPRLADAETSAGVYERYYIEFVEHCTDINCYHGLLQCCTHI